MLHYSLWDLKVFEQEFLKFSPERLIKVQKGGASFFLVFDRRDYCVKFYSSFPGYRLVHIPVSRVYGSDVLSDLYPARVVRAKVLNNDRVFGIWFTKSKFEFAIIFELIGSHTNFVVLNGDGKVIYLGRKIKDGRGLKTGAYYSLPEKNIFVNTPQRVCIDEIDPSTVIKGYVCTSGEIGSWSHAKREDAICIEYQPYTYAVEKYFEDIEGYKKHESGDAKLIASYIDAVKSKFPHDYIFDTDIVEVGQLKIPVKKGVRVSKLVGQWRASVFASMSRKDQEAKSYKGMMEYTSPSGKRVLVGKTADVNHRLTFNMAKKHDYLFHIRDFPGAHVVIFTEGDEPTEEDIVFCANLALRHSKAGGGKQEIIYAPVSDICRRKGMPKGLVLFKKYKSILLEK